MSAASVASRAMSSLLRRSTTQAVASIWCAARNRLASAVSCVAAAGGEEEMAAFLGEGFGGGRTDALGGAGDENALAAQMQVHGMSRFA